MIGEHSVEIVKRFTPKDAPTASRNWHITSDGRVWRPFDGNNNNADYPGTGETVGRVVGNRIEIKRF